MSQELRAFYMIVGVDEAGRGPLAGVVTGCALYLKQEPPFRVRDSKELNASAREKIFDWLFKNSIFTLAIATPREIDTLNILQATFLTFNRAIKGLLYKAPYLAKARYIIDGNLFSTDLKIDYVCMEKADKLVKTVSCASIMAKVSRDHLMRDADFLYPKWGFAQHKGYPTRSHFLLAKKAGLRPYTGGVFIPVPKIMKGSFFEEKACEFFKHKGFSILERNFHCRFGEIDIIAREKDCIVFIEVKARTQGHRVSGLEAVDFHKRQKIKKTARYYSADKPDCHYRFDVLEIMQGKDWRQYNWVKSAFDMTTP